MKPENVLCCMFLSTFFWPLACTKHSGCLLLTDELTHIETFRLRKIFMHSV